MIKVEILRICDDFIKHETQNNSEYLKIQNYYKNLYINNILPKHWLNCKLDIIQYCPSNGKLLEIGSYTGSMSFLLNDIFPNLNIVSIDKNKNVIDYLKKYNRDNLIFKNIDFFDIDESFDYILTEQTILGKIKPYENIIQEISKKTKIGAIFGELKKDVLKKILIFNDKLNSNLEAEIDNDYEKFEELLYQNFNLVEKYEKDYYIVYKTAP